MVEDGKFGPKTVRVFEVEQIIDMPRGKQRAAIDALLARATSAEQERDALRADAVEVARALLDERGQVAAEPAAHRILAGSGERPGDWASRANQASRDAADALSRDFAYQADDVLSSLARPAPMVADQVVRLVAATNVDGVAAVEAERHHPEDQGAGCICGFVVWSGEHVAVMAGRAVMEHIRRMA